jgi:hypothetical protein
MNTEKQNTSVTIEAAESQPPDRIWLQWYGNADPEFETGEINVDDVSWCLDKIFEHDIEYVRANQPQSDQPSVESTLAELREMFPGKFIRVHRSETIQYDEKDDKTNFTEREAFVFVGINQETYKLEPTLSEAMAAVRKWKEGQK